MIFKFFFFFFVLSLTVVKYDFHSGGKISLQYLVKGLSKPFRQTNKVNDNKNIKYAHTKQSVENEFRTEYVNAHQLTIHVHEPLLIMTIGEHFWCE